MEETLKNPPFDHLTNTSFDHLPLEIFSDILMRLPLDLLITLKSVSKTWYDTIRNLGKVEEEPGVLIVGYDKGKTSLRYIKGGEEMETVCHRSHILKNSCNGLLCFWKYEPGHYDSKVIVICNPTLNESITLPKTEADTKCTVRLGYSPSTKEYKAVLLPLDCWSRPKIHTLGTSSWRDISNFTDFLFYGDNIVYANGGLHEKLKRSTLPRNELTDNLILSFDIGSEEFYITDVPKSMKSVLVRYNTCLVSLRSCLAIVNPLDDSSIEIWVLKDNIEKQWVKEYVLNFGILPGRMMSDFVVFGFWKQGKILLGPRYYFSLDEQLEDYRLISYDTKTEQIEDVSNINATIPFPTNKNVHAYTRSLVSLESYGY